MGSASKVTLDIAQMVVDILRCTLPHATRPLLSVLNPCACVPLQKVVSILASLVVENEVLLLLEAKSKF